MELTQKYNDALATPYYDRLGHPYGHTACCGARELAELPDTATGIAYTIRFALTQSCRKGEINFLTYSAPIDRYNFQIKTLLSFGFQSLGRFYNPNTGLTLEALYFIRNV